MTKRDFLGFWMGAFAAVTIITTGYLEWWESLLGYTIVCSWIFSLRSEE